MSEYSFSKDLDRKNQIRQRRQQLADQNTGDRPTLYLGYEDKDFHPIPKQNLPEAPKAKTNPFFQQQQIYF